MLRSCAETTALRYMLINPEVAKVVDIPSPCSKTSTGMLLCKLGAVGSSFSMRQCVNCIQQTWWHGCTGGLSQKAVWPSSLLPLNTGNGSAGCNDLLLKCFPRCAGTSVGATALQPSLRNAGKRSLSCPTSSGTSVAYYIMERYEVDLLCWLDWL